MANTYSVQTLESARRQLKQLSDIEQQRVRRAIRRLAQDPRPKGARLVASTGPERIWRIRVGDYRVLYQVNNDQLVMLVIRVGHRREVYR